MYIHLVMKIQCSSDPYHDAIALYLKGEFPVLVQKEDSQLLDLLTGAIIASGQVRFGPAPSPESQVAIREVISHWMAKGEPIPFLLPWGSEKPDGSGIDIAELMAMKTLNCLYHRVTKFYAPGVQYRIRVEDASAPHLFFDNMDTARRNAAIYTSGFVNLAKTLGFDSFVNIIPESTMTTEAAFNQYADNILPVMVEHVNNPNDQAVREKLLTFGWKVPLSPETLDYYMARYSKIYADKPLSEQKSILARYFAGALARVGLGITGASPTWGGKFLELSFAQPTPGIGADRARRRLYYRTMPSSITSKHMPAWRCKGYLEINGEVTAGLASFHDTALQFNPNVIMLTDGTNTQTIQADYIVKDSPVFTPSI